MHTAPTTPLITLVRSLVAARVAQCLRPLDKAASLAFAEAWFAVPACWRGGRLERVVNAGAAARLRRVRSATIAERRTVRDALDRALAAA